MTMLLQNLMNSAFYVEAIMIWVLGSEGLLGKEIGRQLTQCDMAWTGSDKDVDITQTDALEHFITGSEISSFSGGGGDKIKWMINCASYSDIDGAEKGGEKERALKVNGEGALNAARVARSKGIRLIHISSSYVFNGNQDVPYTEESTVSPVNVYGKSKAIGEENVAKEMTQFYILRTSSVYGFDKDNFVYKMVRSMNKNPTVKAAKDIVLSPTFAGDVAHAVIKLIQKAEGAKTLFGKSSPAPYGIYHYCSEGNVSLADYAEAIRDIGRKCGRVTRDCQVLRCSAKEYNAMKEGSAAAVPMNCVFDTTKITKALKIHIPSWQSSLEAFMKSNNYKEC